MELGFLPKRFFCFAVLLPLLANIPCDLAHATTGEDTLAHEAARFEKEIRPILAGQCIQCHGKSKQEGGLRLDSLEGLLQGGDSGPALVPGKPDESPLIDAIRYSGLEMPPSGKLPDKEIERLENWVARGAVWPSHLHELRPMDAPISESDRNWWAFQPLRSPSPPILEADDWSTNPIDRFIWKELQNAGLEPAPEAEKELLLRRLYFDLIGLPPTPEETERFVQDTTPDAWEKTIDRLLEDPRYGEHWARFWLDLVRFSESDGWNLDSFRPLLWRYRDYIVDAFNSDIPYPQFVLEQLAGDEIPSDDPRGLIAAGFLRLGVYEYNQRDAQGQWNDIVNEMTDVAGDVFLGVSMSCARCHQHKFDPIPQRNYFQWRAFFEPVCWQDDVVAATDLNKEKHRIQQSLWEKETTEIRSKLTAILEPYEKKKWLSTVDKFPLDIQACFHMPRTARTSWQEQMAYLVSRQYMEEAGGPYKGMKKEDVERRAELEKELAAFDHLEPAPLPTTMTVSDFDGLLSPTRIPEDPTRTVIPPGFLDVLNEVPGLPSFVEIQSDSSEKIRPGTSGRRTALARWIAHPKNPLTTRVIVNRVWQQHFGKGLVATSSDFGRLGDKPSHPELLDWLTAEFVEGGWTLKRLHKQILMSSVWKQSSSHPDAARHQSIDPGELLLWRAPVRRLRAEQIRDAMLVATGELDASVGGPSVSEEKPRRSLYLKSLRNQNDTFLHGFDMANGLQSVAVRDTTTTPLQSLLLWNGKYTRQRAERLAKRLTTECTQADDALTLAFQRTWGRSPTSVQLEQVKAFVELGNGEESPNVSPDSMADLCHILLNSNQFLYLD